MTADTTQLPRDGIRTYIHLNSGIKDNPMHSPYCPARGVPLEDFRSGSVQLCISRVDKDEFRSNLMLAS
eukprot:2283159-Amphidinium_carterae.1